jgi:predicted metal-dependent HD superfamily phosphohydrolase
LEKLQVLWRQCLLTLQAGPNQINAGWQRMEKAYSAPGRHYHNLHHLAYMAQLLQAQRHLLQNETTVWLALFFHDFVYKVTRHDNEERSAEDAAAFLKTLDADEKLISEVTAMITATKKHELSGHSDTNYFIDADLAILGAPPETYDNYTRQIRKEYRIYLGLIYKPGRKKVLAHFLSMPQIFKTDAFNNQFEQPARENLQRELDGL